MPRWLVLAAAAAWCAWSLRHALSSAAVGAVAAAAAVTAAVTAAVHTDGVLALAAEAGCGVVIFAPFNSGILAGGAAALKERAKFNYFDASEDLIEQVLDSVRGS